MTNTWDYSRTFENVFYNCLIYSVKSYQAGLEEVYLTENDSRQSLFGIHGLSD